MHSCATTVLHACLGTCVPPMRQIGSPNSQTVSATSLQDSLGTIAHFSPGTWRLSVRHSVEKRVKDNLQKRNQSDQSYPPPGKWSDMFLEQGVLITALLPVFVTSAHTSLGTGLHSCRVTSFGTWRNSTCKACKKWQSKSQPKSKFVNFEPYKNLYGDEI